MICGWRLFSFQGNVGKKFAGPLPKMTVICPTLMGFVIDDGDSAAVTGDSVFCHGKENTPLPIKCTRTYTHTHTNSHLISSFIQGFLCSSRQKHNEWTPRSTKKLTYTVTHRHTHKTTIQNPIIIYILMNPSLASSHPCSLFGTGVSHF